MKFTLERAVMLTALGHVQSVVERRNTIPILSNVEMVAAEERLGTLDRFNPDTGGPRLNSPACASAARRPRRS